MANQYLVLSDLHLCDVEEHPDGWKAYKSARFSVDDELAELLRDTADRHQAERSPGDTLTLILNGDIVDFDLVNAVPDPAPFSVSIFEQRRGLHATAEKSAWKLERVLHDHPVFLDALARFLAAGHRVVYVMGNHDRELHFPEVQDVLRNAIGRAAVRAGVSFPHRALLFEPWFYHVPGEIYAEHGQQYDYYSSFRYVLSPVVKTRLGPMIALPMGDLANRYLITRMGFFNPHASDYILNVFHYFVHWLRHYAFTRRSIVWNWFWGSVLVMAQLLKLKKRIHRRPAHYNARLERAARRARLPLATVRAIGKLHPPPITTRFFRIAREFWIDRLLLALVMMAGTLTLALSPVPLWVKLMVPLSTFPLLYSVYEWIARGDSIFTIEHEIPGYARRVAELVGVQVVTFGHTHRPRIIPLASGKSFVDTGTWAQIPSKEDASAPAPGLRNYLLVTFASSGTQLKLDSWVKPVVQQPQPSALRLAS